MGAIATTLLTLLSNGDHVVASNSIYASTHSLLTHHCKRFGIETSMVDASNCGNIENAMRDNTKIVYIETPSNPLLSLVDIQEAAKIAHKYGALLVVDSTFASPYGQTPISYGADIVVHSATKYINGHGDVVAGLVVSTKDIIYKLRNEGVMDITGACLSPYNAWLTLRGIKTLGLRIKQISKSAQQVAEFLESNPLIEQVNYPGLKSHPQYELASKQMNYYSGVISFEIKGGVEAGRQLMTNVKLCSLAVSLGDAETLIEHPASMTHTQLTREERMEGNISDGLVRISIGLEDPDDIVEDLNNALNKIKL